MVTALVSGGNRGLGYGIVRRLANEFPTSSLYPSSENLTIYLGSRDLSKGEEAKKSITSELDSAARDRVSIKVCQLDTSSHQSITKLASELKPGVDILINNAGIALDGFDAEIAKKTVATNYYAVKDIINNIPVNDGGRIVTIASSTGVLRGFSDEVRDKFRNAKTIEDVDALMEEFQKVVADGTWKEKGWKGAAYATSKSGVIAYTRALAHKYRQEGKKVGVFSCCPGYVNTDMTKGKGHKTLDQGAETPVLLALHKTEAKPGEFWFEKKAYDWEVKSSHQNRSQLQPQHRHPVEILPDTSLADAR